MILVSGGGDSEGVADAEVQGGFLKHHPLLLHVATRWEEPMLGHSVHGHGQQGICEGVRVWAVDCESEGNMNVMV